MTNIYTEAPSAPRTARVGQQGGVDLKDYVASMETEQK